MITPTFPEYWLRGPVAGVAPLLQPIAHSLLQTREDAARAAEGLEREELWVKPGGAASAGFHLRHIAGVVDRLTTYARGESLSETQLAYLRREAESGDGDESSASLVAAMQRAIDRALEQVSATPEADLLAPRRVGRAGLPSTVLGLLFHAAEHAQRHTGQLLVVERILRPLPGFGRDRAWSAPPSG